jgi:multidrug efflux pump subunit AcrA (membrane-fusion protein)
MSYAMTLQNSQDAAAVAQARGAAEQARGAAEQARAQAQQARAQAQEQRNAANEARQEARDAAQEARDAAREGQSGTGVITIVKDGKSITLNDASPAAVATALGIAPPNEFHEPDPGPYIVGGISIISAAIVLLVALTQRYRIRMRGGAAPAALSADVTQRLTRMEAGIEAVAVEVERISEGQRFTTRLLSDRERMEVPRG